MSSPRRPNILNQMGNVHEHYHDFLRLTYQHYVRSLPLSARLPMCSMLIQCFCPAPSVIAVWNDGQLHEHISWFFHARESNPVAYRVQRALS